MSRRQRPADPAQPQPDAATVNERRAEILAEVQRLSRNPARAEFARFLACGPSDEAIIRAAERFPDRWCQALAVLGRLAGFSERLEVEGDIALNVRHLSDSELAERLRVAEARLRALSAPALPAETETSAPGPWTPRRADEQAAGE